MTCERDNQDSTFYLYETCILAYSKIDHLGFGGICTRRLWLQSCDTLSLRGMLAGGVDKSQGSESKAAGLGAEDNRRVIQGQDKQGCKAASCRYGYVLSLLHFVLVQVWLCALNLALHYCVTWSTRLQLVCTLGELSLTSVDLRSLPPPLLTFSRREDPVHATVSVQSLH
jgi:hypothetical protein